MTPQQYISNLSGVISDLKGGAHLQVVEDTAMSALAMIKARVINTGVSSTGTKYRDYSTEGFWASEDMFTIKTAFRKMIKNKSYNAVTAIDGKVKYLYKGGYKQFKIDNGRFRGVTDFMFTGHMWNDINIRKSRINQKYAIIKPGRNENDLKLAKNEQSFGNILALTEAEKQRTAENYNNGVLQIFRNHNL